MVEAIEPLGLNLTPCQEKKRRMKQLTEEVQAALFALNHPSNCAAAPLLECDSGQGLDQGTGSRLFFLTRCVSSSNQNLRQRSNDGGARGFSQAENV